MATDHVKPLKPTVPDDWMWPRIRRVESLIEQAALLRRVADILQRQGQHEAYNQVRAKAVTIEQAIVEALLA